MHHYIVSIVQIGNRTRHNIINSMYHEQLQVATLNIAPIDNYTENRHILKSPLNTEVANVYCRELYYYFIAEFKYGRHFLKVIRNWSIGDRVINFQGVWMIFYSK